MAIRKTMAEGARQVAELMVALNEDWDEELDPLTLDDALWCLAYEPWCGPLRTACNHAAGVNSKTELILWCLDHSLDEQRALVLSAGGDADG